MKGLALLLRFSIFNTIFVFVLAYFAYFQNGISLLLTLDPTRVTFLILAVYVGLSAYLGIYREKASFRYVRSIASTFTSIGLLGTILGIMHLLSSLGGTDLTDIKTVSVYLFAGAAPVFLTTFFGVAAWLLTRYQLLFVFGATDDDE